MLHDWKKTKRYRDVRFDMEFEFVFYYAGCYLQKRKINKKRPTPIAFLKEKK